MGSVISMTDFRSSKAAVATSPDLLKPKRTGPRVIGVAIKPPGVDVPTVFFGGGISALANTADIFNPKFNLGKYGDALRAERNIVLEFSDDDETPPPPQPPMPRAA